MLALEQNGACPSMQLLRYGESDIAQHTGTLQEQHEVAPPIQVLVVDDFLPWQHLVRKMFESETDFKIKAIATDGLEAVQKATELQPDVILMDISLPKITGFEAAQHIRLLSPTSRILFVSEHRNFDFIEAAFQAGGLGYLLKSDAGSDLFAGIRAVVRGQLFVSRSLNGWTIQD
jgi:two-component system, NarL family, response regulator NreC